MKLIWTYSTQSGEMLRCIRGIILSRLPLDSLGKFVIREGLCDDFKLSMQVGPLAAAIGHGLVYYLVPPWKA